MESLTKIVLGFIGGMAAAAVGLYTDILDIDIRRQNSELEMMKFAFSVYGSDPEKTGEGFRRWACQTIDDLSNRPLDCEKKDILEAQISATSSSSSALPPSIPGNPGRTDVDVFVCRETNVTARMATNLQAELAKFGLGRLRTQVWTSTEYSPEELVGKTLVILDPTEPERGDYPLIAEAIERAGDLPPIQPEDNRGTPTRWLISVIICPAE